MDIMEIRRENLRRWVEKNGVPVKERSFFSQLKSGASFGERLARRLERDYKMGDGFLDRLDAEVAVEQPVSPVDAIGLRVESAEELRLLTVYRLANQRERREIDEAVEAVRGHIAARTTGY
ncbi:hypothetical protein [Massilia endophytica]|uniref:hypothetical protein n=1 Tax=Massilia endophytica TaxID=2899220 RepID=UPI001E299D20|nr:hypothetical protein [Massilia endophytica]UGQ44953.1 hypothetical protein LSQ66_14215 [Massilia endophytica]